MRKVIALWGLLFILTGCVGRGNEILQPSDILQQSSNEQELSHPLGASQLTSQHSEEGLFLQTVENDLFYLDPTLVQYKLSDQVSYFDFDKATNTIKIQKKDNRWIVWFLENKKPQFVPAASDLKILGESHQIVYSGLENQNLYLLEDEESNILFEGTVKLFDTTLNGQLIIVQDDQDTLRVINHDGKIIYEQPSVMAYRFEKANQSMMIWAKNQGIVVKLSDDRAMTYKVLDEVTDWLMFPTYSENFETMVYFSELNLESGMGTMTVTSSLNPDPIHLANVINYSIMTQGTYVYYLTDKSELYGLDVESSDVTFLGSNVGQINIDTELDCATYKSNDDLYLIDRNHQVQVVAQDVYQYDYNGTHVAYMNSINDLYLEYKGLTTKIDESVSGFALGNQGVYYHKKGQIYYKPFEGVKEVIVDQSGHYKNIFFHNTQLYQKEVELTAITGYWMVEVDKIPIIYYFDSEGHIEMMKQEEGPWSYLRGQYEVLYSAGTVMNLYVRYLNGLESYLTLSLLDSNTLQIAENDQINDVVAVTEKEAMSLISKLEPLPTETE